MGNACWPTPTRVLGRFSARRSGAATLPTAAARPPARAARHPPHARSRAGAATRKGGRNAPSSNKWCGARTRWTSAPSVSPRPRAARRGRTPALPWDNAGSRRAVASLRPRAARRRTGATGTECAGSRRATRRASPRPRAARRRTSVGTRVDAMPMPRVDGVFPSMAPRKVRKERCTERGPRLRHQLRRPASLCSASRVLRRRGGGGLALRLGAGAFAQGTSTLTDTSSSACTHATSHLSVHVSVGAVHVP
jgi:hypothetical protein